MTYYFNINSVFVLATHALINFVNKVANAVDCQKYLARIFLDLSKAFDTQDHAILLSRLEACGITGTAHQWVTDYFRNRMQYVQIVDSKYDALRQFCGVPQGSILGPLFLLFISVISQPALALMNSKLYYLLMTPVYFLNIVTWMYLPPILTTSSAMFQLG